jgi:hypothetical protein
MFGIRSTNHVQQDTIEWRYGIAAACVGPLSAIISTPFELVKTQAQLFKKNNKAERSISSISTIRLAHQLVSNHGISSIYRGHLMNTAREMVFLYTYFMAYEHFKSAIVEFISAPKAIAIATAGGISGALGWFVSFPLDNIKSNIQGAPIDSSSTKPTSLQIARHLLQTRGLAGLYSGVAPSIARAFLVSATRFSAYEAALKFVDSN